MCLTHPLFRYMIAQLTPLHSSPYLGDSLSALPSVLLVSYRDANLQIYQRFMPHWRKIANKFAFSLGLRYLCKKLRKVEL